MPRTGSPSRSGRTGRRKKIPRSLPLNEESPDFESRWFELDRAVAISQLNVLRRTVSNGALLLEAIAMERMFDQPLSEAILLESKMMRRQLRELKMLLAKVASTTAYPTVEEP